MSTDGKINPKLSRYRRRGVVYVVLAVIVAPLFLLLPERIGNWMDHRW